MTSARPGHAVESGASARPRSSGPVPVLIVEDERVAALLLAILHDGNGVSYDMASSAAQAIDFVRAKTYELVLLNAVLPDGNGVTVAETIRGRDGSARHTAIVIVTADGSQETRERFEAVGVEGIVVKPVNPDMMQRLWQKWVPSAGIAADGPKRPSH